MKAFLLNFLASLLALSASAQNPGNKPAVHKDSTQLKNIRLKEVAIKSRRPLIQMEMDKTVVNVSSMIGSAGSNTLEVLEKTPGILVGPNGEISLNGRSGVMVLLDGRQTYMSGTDLAAYLKSIPGASLDKIELMDNPPAKYDAAGNGIINIRLKKNREGGFTGSIASGYSQGEFARTNNNLNLNYNHKKLNLFANLGHNYEKNYSQDSYQRSYFESSGLLSSRILLGNEQQYHNNGLNSNLGLDYSPTANTTFGMQFNLNDNAKDGYLHSWSDNYSSVLDSLSRGNTVGGEDKTNVMSNLNFTHRFGKSGIEWSADANYLRYTGEGNQQLENQVFRPDGIALDQDQFLYHLPNTMNIYTLKTDYVQPLKNKARIEAGFKWSTVKNDNQSDYFRLLDGNQLADNSRSNHFQYQEDFTAAYVNAQKAWKQFGIQAGLRVEHTSAAGTQLGNAEVAGSTFSKDYTQFFPTLFLSYKLDTASRNTLVFSISRRINRPNYQQLNPFTFFRDKYSYNSGNPDLEPQYQYRYELKYQYRQVLRMGLSYNHFTNVIFQTTNVQNGIFITRPENVQEGYMLLLNTGISLAPAKWWNLNTDVLLSRMGLNGRVYGEALRPSTYVARINLINQFQFEKGWSGELGGYYASRDLNGQTFTAGMYRVNAGLQKKVLNNKGSIRLNMDDMFHSWKYLNRSIALKQAYYLQNSESDTRRVSLAFSYSFGSDTFARKSKHRDNALDEEKSRM